MGHYVAGGYFQNAYSSWNIQLSVFKLETSTNPWSWSTLTILPGNTYYSPHTTFGDRYIMTPYGSSVSHYFKDSGESGTLAAQTPMKILSSTGNNLIVYESNLYLFYHNGQIFKLDETLNEWILQPKTLDTTVRGKILLVSWNNLP